MRRQTLISTVLFLITLAVFHRVAGAGFLAWDDAASVPDNTSVQGLDLRRLGWMFSNVSYAMRYKPLTWLAYGLIHAGAGLNPRAYHLANLILHGLNAVLVYLVIHELLWLRRRQGESTFSAGHTRAAPAALAGCAGLGALAWALNPLRVEVVARVTDLAYCNALFFLLISTWCYLRAGSRSAPGSVALRYYWGAVAAFALSMLSYPFAFGYVGVLVVLDVYPLRRLGGSTEWWRSTAARRVWLEKVPFVLLGGLILLTFLGRLSPQGIWAQDPSGTRLTLWAKAMQATYIWTYYLWKPWVPLQLSPVNTILVTFNPWGWRFLASAGLIAGLTALLVWKCGQWPWALALWLCHLVLLLAALGVTEHPHYPCDRYSYIPGVLWGVWVAGVLWWLHNQRRRFLWAVTATTVGLAALGCGSFQQTRIWLSNVSLFEYMLSVLGKDPYRAEIHWRLGHAYAEEQRPDLAMRQYRLSLEAEPNATACFLLAQALAAQGKYGEALAQYERALQLRPAAEIHVAAAELLRQQGQIGEAVGHYRAAVQMKPGLWPVLNNLAWILATSPLGDVRNGPEAVRLAEKACQLTAFREAGTLGTLGAAYAEAGRFPEAIAAAERAIALAAATGNQPLAEHNQQLLQLYRAGKPYRELPAARQPPQRASSTPKR